MRNERLLTFTLFELFENLKKLYNVTRNELTLRVVRVNSLICGVIGMISFT